MWNAPNRVTINYLKSPSRRHLIIKGKFSKEQYLTFSKSILESFPHSSLKPKILTF